MQSPVKILYVYGDTLRLGGIERVMLNYFRWMDRKAVHIDFVLQGKEESVFEREILDAGSCVYRLPKPGRHPLRYLLELAKIIKSGGYGIVHGHCDAMNCRIMRIAKQCGVPVRIAHSHNTEHILDSKARYLFYEHCRRRVGRYATERWACSDAAGKWLFGNYPYRVIPNAIELNKFAFQKEKRDALRARFGIAGDEIVLGHVGRFHTQKNHAFMVDLLAQLCRAGGKYRLMLVGSGGMMETIQDMAMIRGVRDKVVFVGGVSDPEEYYHAMDLFVLPSLFEGFGLVVVEAEANGLKCLVSDRVPQDAALPGRVRFLPLELPEWMSAVRCAGVPERQDEIEALRAMGLDIRDAAKWAQDEYVRLYRAAESGKGADA